MIKILNEYGDVRKLSKEFGVSEPTIRSAIKGKTKSVLAQKIRDRITKGYGRQVVELR